jgi:hypothetical protein
MKLWRSPAFIGVLCVGASAIAGERSSTSPAGDTIQSNVQVNALGVLVFGLTGAFELGTSHWGTAARARWLNSGLVARSKFPADDNQSLVFSYGAALGVRYYGASSGPLTGMFVGPAVEYVHARVEDHVVQIATLTSLVVPQVEAGYRWRIGALLIDIGAGAGYALVLERGVEDLGGGHNAANYQDNAANTPYLSVLGDIGYFF